MKLKFFLAQVLLIFGCSSAFCSEPCARQRRGKALLAIYDSTDGAGGRMAIDG